VTTIWTCVALTALASFAIKATGPAILGNRLLPSRAAGVIALLAPALLAGLVISDILGPNWSSANGPLALDVEIAKFEEWDAAGRTFDAIIAGHAISQARAMRRAAGAGMSISARLQNVAGRASANRGRVVA
jgi:hypothetical protein